MSWYTSVYDALTELFLVINSFKISALLILKPNFFKTAKLGKIDVLIYVRLRCSHWVISWNTEFFTSKPNIVILDSFVPELQNSWNYLIRSKRTYLLLKITDKNSEYTMKCLNTSRDE